MSMRGYARHRGVSLTAVQKAIKAGRISTDPSGKIDPESADTAWAKNTAPRPGRTAVKSAVPQSKKAAAAGKKKTHVAKSAETGGGYQVSRAETEKFRARMARLNYEERLGKLVKREDVEAQAFQTFRTFRDGMMNIADRVSAQLAAETDERAVHKILDTEIRKALQEFADGDVR